MLRFANVVYKYGVAYIVHGTLDSLNADIRKCCYKMAKILFVGLEISLTRLGEFYQFLATNCLTKSSPNILATIWAISNNVTIM